MPRNAPLPCRHPGCAALVDSPGYCQVHRSFGQRDYGRARRWFDAEVDFYKSSRWRKTRTAFLKQYPLCLACGAIGKTVAATVVDHIQPIKAGGTRFDWDNLQSLCVSCHNRKTANESKARYQHPIGGVKSLARSYKDATVSEDFCAC